MSTFERYFRAEGEAKGIVIGEAKGIAIGEAKGRVEGEVKGTENTIRNFIERKEAVMCQKKIFSRNCGWISDWISNQPVATWNLPW